MTLIVRVNKNKKANRQITMRNSFEIFDNELVEEKKSNKNIGLNARADQNLTRSLRFETQIYSVGLSKNVNKKHEQLGDGESS